MPKEHNDNPPRNMPPPEEKIPSPKSAGAHGGNILPPEALEKEWGTLMKQWEVVGATREGLFLKSKYFKQKNEIDTMLMQFSDKSEQEKTSLLKTIKTKIKDYDKELHPKKHEETEQVQAQVQIGVLNDENKRKSDPSKPSK